MNAVTNPATAMLNNALMPDMQAGNSTEKGALIATAVILALVPIGEEGKAAGAEGKSLTYLYEKLGANGEHLKYGITNNPLTRYTEKRACRGSLKILASGERKAMLTLERNLHSTLPIGPEERQTF
jgi:hypothetical protein